MADLEEIIAEHTAYMQEHGSEMTAERERFERQLRIEEARALTRDQLPGAFQVPSSELEKRIKNERLAAGVELWSWGQNLLLMGDTGEGKTSALALLWRGLLSRGITQGGDEWERARRMVWVRAAELAEERFKHKRGKGDVPIVKAAREASLLFLDDMNANPDAIQEVWKLIEFRYDVPANTVMTTGLKSRFLTEHYGAAVVRKMRQACGRTAIVVDTFQLERVISGTPEPDGKMRAAGDV